ncbi:MAG: ANTAR domain-containing response regulator [Suipraeoptans sp.]
MFGIIVVFPNKDNATGIRNLLVRQGIEVKGVCTTGAEALRQAALLDDGIIICGYKMSDMIFSELREYLSDKIEMLLVASRDKWSSGTADGIMGLTMPIKAYELISTVNMMMDTIDVRRRKAKKEKKVRNDEEKKLINEAKALLMERNNMTEEEAHRYLQKGSMNTGKGLVYTAKTILTTS